MNHQSEFKSEGLYNWCGKIASLVTTNLLWILCSLPVFTAGAATKAMYFNLYALLKGEDCSAGSFFRAFRENFPRVTVIWIVMLFAAVFLGIDYYLIAYMEFTGRMAVIGVIFFAVFLLVLSAGVMFPMLSQFSMSVKDAVVNGVLISFAHLPKVFLAAAMNLLPWLLLLVSTKWFVILGIFWLLCGYALIGLYNAKLLDEIFSIYRSKVPDEI